MSLDSLYADELQKGAQDLAGRPVFGPLPEAQHSWADLAKAPFLGGASGVLESAATWSPFFQLPGGPMLKGGGFAPATPDQVEQWKHIQPDDQAAALRQTAKDVMPDPQTASTAAEVVAGFSRFGVKAAAYTGTAGPIAGAALLGTDEGNTEYARLRAQGVDAATAAKAGAVAGVVSGASMVPGMSGASWAIRAAKGVAVGEGANISQAAGERWILDHSGYQQQAGQFDPFDPVALAVGLVPGVLGAAFGHAPTPPRLADVVAHLESGGLQNPDAAVSPKGALGRMQVMPATAADPGFGIEAAKKGPDGQYQPGELDRVGTQYLDVLRQRYGNDAQAMAAYNAGPGAVDAAVKAHGEDWLAHLPQETQSYVQRGLMLLGGPDAATVDAARVTQTASSLERTRLTAPGDFFGADAHQGAVETAFDQLARGEPVAVPFGDELLGRMQDQRSIEDRVQALEDERAQLLGPPAGNELEPGQAGTLREQLLALESQVPDQNVQARAKELQGPNVSYKQALGQAQREVSATVSEHEAAVQRLQQQLAVHAAGAQARERIDLIDREIAAAREQGGQLPGPSTAPRRLALAMSQAFDEMRARGAVTPEPEPVRGPNAQAFYRAAEAAKEPAGETVRPARETPAALPGTEPVPAGTEAARGETASPLDAAIAQVDPELMVRLEGMDKAMPVSDLLQQLREEAHQTGRDADLIHVAAACALRS